MYKHVCADCFWYIMMLFLNHIQGHRVFRFNWGHKGSLSPQFSVVPNRHRIVSPCFHSNARNQLVLSRTYLVLVDFAWSHNQIAQQSAVCCFVFSQLFSAAPRCLCASPCAGWQQTVGAAPSLLACAQRSADLLLLLPRYSTTPAPLLLLHRYLYPALRLLRCSAYPASAAAACIQILCAAPLFCTWSTQPATHFWAATLKASSTGSLGTGPQLLKWRRVGGWWTQVFIFSTFRNALKQIKRKWYRYQLRRNI